MTQPLPKWVIQRYSRLWVSFGINEFQHKDALCTLNNDKMTSVILSNLKKAGWLDVRLAYDDGRKRVYRLKNPETAIRELAENKR